MSQLLTQVTNTVTSAVTLFESYPYNSMCQFQGKYLAAGAGGLVQLDTPTTLDPIVSTLTTGELHFGSEFQKRCSDFYLAMRSEGVITLRVTTDEDNTYEYTVDPLTVATLNQRRTWIGKGAKGKYWTFELVCSDPFDYDTMNIAMVIVSRRLK